MAPPVLQLEDIEPRRVEFGHICAEWSFVGLAAGCVGVGCRRIRIEPGRFSTPLHVHAHDEETFFLLAGSGLSVQDDRTYAVRAGDCIVHAEGKEAHTLKAGDDGLDTLVFGASRERSTGARLPRIGLDWTARSWHEVGEGKVPFEREADVGPPDCPEPSERPPNIVNVDGVEVDQDTRENYRGEWRFLGASAGAKRTGLNHIRLEPGQMTSPPHCHSAEEELFVVLEGSGTLLLGDESHELRRGSIVSRPPGTRVAHALVSGDEGMTLLAYGTREADDMCYYPRSNKIFFRGLGVIARLEQLDYWDGEA